MVIAYFCDYNWDPVTFEKKCCPDVGVWEEKSRIYAQGNEFLCCSSADFSIKMIYDSESHHKYLIEYFVENKEKTDYYEYQNMCERAFISKINAL